MVLFTLKLLMAIHHHVDTVYVLLSACCHLWLQSVQKGSTADWWPAELSSAFQIFCMSFSAARITSHGMHLSSHLSLVLYLVPFFIFNGLMIKDFLVINNMTCQMPIRGGMMSESHVFNIYSLSLGFCMIIIIVWHAQCFLNSITLVTR